MDDRGNSEEGSGARAPGDPGSQTETHEERVNRELIELLNELRVVLPGVQVLFAFLLTVPFTQRASTITAGEQGAYFATFALTAAALTMLMAPTSYHRLRFRGGDKERMLHTSNRFAIAGTSLLALALGGAVFLVSELLYGAALASAATALMVAGAGWAWFALPVTRRIRDR